MKSAFAAMIGLGFGIMPGLALAADSMAFRGPYVGANLGAAHGSSSFKTDPGCPPDPAQAVFCNASPDPSGVNGTAVGDSGTRDLSDTGLTGGIQAGYNERTNNLVYGVEADVGLLRLGQSSTATGTFPFAFAATDYAVEQSMSTDWLATLRGRVGGIVTPKLLLYATGGLALTELEVTTRYSDNATGGGLPGGSGSATDSSLRPGWTLGVGGEWLLDGPWSLKAEYLFARFGSKSFDVPTSNTVDFQQTMRVKADLDVHILRIGLNYRF